MSNDSSDYEFFLKLSHDEAAKARPLQHQTYVFGNVEKTVLAEYTFQGRKYLITDSPDQNGRSRTEIFILEEGGHLILPEADDHYFQILTSIKNAQFPHDVII